MRLKRIICLLTLLCLAAAALPLPQNAAKASAAYYITVDVTNQIVTVYDNGNTSDSGIVRQMICSTGTKANPTPLGTFTLPAKTRAAERTEWYYFSEYNCYAKWATRIYSGILFHSILYTAAKKGPTSSSKKALGSRASHGCVRLQVEDAKWIALNCPAGTKVKIFNGTANKDLAKKVKAKTFSRDVETYDHYLGRAEGSSSLPAKINLSKGKKGGLVSQLQERLRALGFYGGAVDAKFGKTTKAAVQGFQAAIGVKKTGKVNNDLWNRIFAADAPTGMLATLSEGWSGPCVSVLQQALADLKLYGGAVDGNFGADTRDAVALYQQNFNLPVNGWADPDLQAEALARSRDVKACFGDTAYQIQTSTAEVTLATVNVKKSIRLRAKASTRGKSLAKLLKNTQVKVLSNDGTWAQVQYKGLIGFVQSKYLNCFAGTEYVVNYEPVPETPPESTEQVALAEPLEEADAGLTIEEEEPVAALAEEAGTPVPAADGEAETAVTADTTVGTTDEATAETPAEQAQLTTADAPQVPAAAQAEEAASEATTDNAAGETEATQPEAAAENGTEVSDEPTPEMPVETVPEAPAEPAPEVTTEAAPEVAVETAPETPVEVVPETPAEPTPDMPAEPLPKYAVTLLDGAPLFAERDAAAAPVAELAAGTALEVVAIEEGWIAVRHGEAEAWIAAAEVQLTDVLPEPAAAEPLIEYGTDAVAPEATVEDDGGTGLTIESEPVPEEAAQQEPDAPEEAPAE